MAPFWKSTVLIACLQFVHNLKNHLKASLPSKRQGIGADD
jgi:hypothetical protein